MVNYNVGDVIEHRTFTGEVRRIVVTLRDPDIKNGRPGFEGRCTVLKPSQPDNIVWGYDDEIVRIVKRCNS